MNLADVKVDVRDVFGRLIEVAEVDVVEKRQQGGKHLVADVTAPGYLRDRVVLDHRGHGELVLLMDPEQCECVITDDAGPHWDYVIEDPADVFGWVLEGEGMAAARLGIWYFINQDSVLRCEPDRAYYPCGGALSGFLDHSGVWSRDPNAGRGHSYEDGWERIGSWRSNTHVVSMQAVVYRDRTLPASFRKGHAVVELDLDMGGLAHVGQVLGNAITGGKTQPVIMAQLAHYYWGLRLPFEMRPKGPAS